VRAEGLEPSRALRPNGFSYPSTAFAAPAVLPQGLGSGLSLHRVPDTFPDSRCCPSSLYTFPAVSGRAWLGIAMLQDSPNLSSSASPVSRRALKFCLSPVRMPFRHARTISRVALSAADPIGLLSPLRLPVSPSRRGKNRVTRGAQLPSSLQQA
jgi:hypothetical protein